jgi:hypothetical protein
MTRFVTVLKLFNSNKTGKLTAYLSPEFFVELSLVRFLRK